MGADEFLPIHMFVLVNARLENPQLLSRQLQQLCDESTIQVCVADASMRMHAWYAFASGFSDERSMTG